MMTLTCSSQRTYAGLNITVEPLKLDQKHLNTKRMLDLMAFNTENGALPLYVHTIYRISSNMRLKQQKSNNPNGFNYAEFKLELMKAKLLDSQAGPLTQRLDTLKSFMDQQQTSSAIGRATTSTGVSSGNDWSLKVCSQEEFGNARD